MPHKKVYIMVHNKHAAVFSTTTLVKVMNNCVDRMLCRKKSVVIVLLYQAVWIRPIIRHFRDD